jgi:hypothetical protein
MARVLVVMVIIRISKPRETFHKKMAQIFILMEIVKPRGKEKKRNQLVGKSHLFCFV